GENQIRPATHHLGRNRLRDLGAAVRIIIIEMKVSLLDPAGRYEAVPKAREPRLGLGIVLRNSDKNRNPPHALLLGAGGVRPEKKRRRRASQRRAADPRNELTPSYSWSHACTLMPSAPRGNGSNQRAIASGPGVTAARC